MDKTYLGDGVYVEVDDCMLRLTTNDGISEDNVIYLEMATYEALKRFVKKLSEKR